MEEKEILKGRLSDYLSRKGVSFSNATPPVLRCINPDHIDKKPSAVIYRTSAGDKTDTVYCPVCAQNWDIFDAASFLTGLSTKSDFPAIVEEIKNTVGIITAEKAPEKKKATTTAKAVHLTIEEGRKIFTPAAALDFCQKINKEITAIQDVTPYITTGGKIAVIEARCTTPAGKTVLSLYYDGKGIRAKNYPICLYNADKFKDDKRPIIINEGGRCAKMAENKLPDFLLTGWNGGAKKAKLAHWELITGKTVYIFPDDDHKKDKDGSELPKEKQPGFSAALEVYEALKENNRVYIVNPVLQSREIKPDGADIIEALESIGPEQLKKHILSNHYQFPVEKPPKEKPSTEERQRKIEGLDFEILGMGDDGQAYFINQEQRLVSFRPEQIGKTRLIHLCEVDMWRGVFKMGKTMSGEDWEDAYSAVVRMSLQRDFSADSVRGRGAWKNKDGSILYHDGIVTTGQPDSGTIYLRKAAKPIGIEADPAPLSLCREILHTAQDMTFETHADCIRALSWSVLAPFTGALPVRPAGLLTGDSGTGKTTISDVLIKKISSGMMVNAHESSVPGIRQAIGNDSCGVILDEAGEGGNEASLKKRNDFFSLMRVSFSDDAPDAYKGTTDQSGKTFKMKNMFLFISISAEVDEVADDKRIFRINLAKKENDWLALKTKLQTLLTDDNCKSIRSRSWANLAKIMKMAEELITPMQIAGGLDVRTAHSEAMLYAAYLIVWQGIEEIPAGIEEMLADYWAVQPKENDRDDVTEMIDRLLDEVVIIPDSHGEKTTIRNLLHKIREGSVSQAILDLVESYGLAYHKPSDGIIIANNHHLIQKILLRGKGYHRQLWRHPRVVKDSNGSPSIVYRIGGKSRRCVVIGKAFDDSEAPF